MNVDHIQGNAIEFDYHINYHQRLKAWKWYWSMWSYGELIAQSTDPQDDEESCLEQIGQVINTIRAQTSIIVTNRFTKEITPFTVVE